MRRLLSLALIPCALLVCGCPDNGDTQSPGATPSAGSSTGSTGGERVADLRCRANRIASRF